jgi:ketosteroid isomerase-like protein
MDPTSLVIGAALAFGGRTLLTRILLLKFSRDVRALNAGRYEGLLSAYADDAVLHFNVGDHRWSGTWTGKAAIEQFLQTFAAAGLQGEIKTIAMSGPPWAMTLWARFDDRAASPDGDELYANRSAIVLRTRWGKVVDHEDFWVDTAAIAEFDRKLTGLGVAASPAAG